MNAHQFLFIIALIGGFGLSFVLLFCKHLDILFEDGDKKMAKRRRICFGIFGLILGIVMLISVIRHWSEIDSGVIPF